MTKIEWVQNADGAQGKTWNPLAGCTVLTPGCTNCYAMKLAARLDRMGQPLYTGLTKQTKGGAVWTGEMRRASDDTLLAPLKRKKPTTYFVNSMSDLFHENVPAEWIDAIFAVMALSPQHTFQVLTKRAARMREYVASKEARARHAMTGFLLEPSAKNIAKVLNVSAWPLPNVWLGVSTERQQEADERIPLLLQTPAAIRFISAEPLLGPIDVVPWLPHCYECGLSCGWRGAAPPEERCNGCSERSETFGEFCSCGRQDFSRICPNCDHDAVTDHPDTVTLDWVIAGGESGHGYRPMAAEWAYSLRDQCMAAGVPVFIKQMAGKKPIPEDLMVRQFPKGAT